MISGGNPAGGSFTGAAEALEIIGNHAYAASGSIQNAGTGGPDTTLLSFTTGNYVFIGTLDFTNNVTGGYDTYLNVTFNNTIVNETKENKGEIVPMRFHFIIPPYTVVTVKAGFSDPFNASVFMAGKIERARD